MKMGKLAAVARSRSAEHIVISRCCFAEDGKEMHQQSLRDTYTVIVLLHIKLNLRFSVVLVPLNSLGSVLESPGNISSP